MTASLPFTGERFTPEVRGAIWYEHWHRYCAARPAAAGKRVLDAACGEGYGSWLLAEIADEVTGIDIDAEAIAHAIARYAGRSNLSYLRGSCSALPFADASFDLIVSFETIEHLAAQDAMLDEFRRVLAPSGALVISSPNKAIYSEATGCENHFHVRELTRDELAAMLGARFARQTWYGQRALAHSLLWAEQRGAPRNADLMGLSGDRVYALDAPAPPMYFIVVCGALDAVLPQLPQLSLFDDGAQSLYRDYERALLAEKRLYWDEINARRIAEQRLFEAITAVNELGSTRQRETALAERVAGFEAELGRLGAELQRTQGAFAQVSNALGQTHARLRYRESLKGWLRLPLSRIKRALGGHAL